MKTTTFNPKSVNTNWHLIDANGQILGRVASRIAAILTGKNKVEFSPNQVISDKVVVINASKIKVTGNKAVDKIYYTHSNFPGGLKSQSYEKRMSKNPSKVLSDAVKKLGCKWDMNKKKWYYEDNISEENIKSRGRCWNVGSWFQWTCSPTESGIWN